MVITLACQVGDPGSIPGVCLYFILFLSLKIDLVSKKVEFKTFLNPFSLNVQRLYCFYYIHIRSQNPIEKSFVMLFEVTNLKWIRLGGESESGLSSLSECSNIWITLWYIQSNLALRTVKRRACLTLRTKLPIGDVCSKLQST